MFVVPIDKVGNEGMVLIGSVVCKKSWDGVISNQCEVVSWLNLHLTVFVSSNHVHVSRSKHILKVIVCPKGSNSNA